MLGRCTAWLDNNIYTQGWAWSSSWPFARKNDIPRRVLQAIPYEKGMGIWAMAWSERRRLRHPSPSDDRPRVILGVFPLVHSHWRRRGTVAQSSGTRGFTLIGIYVSGLVFTRRLIASLSLKCRGAPTRVYVQNPDAARVPEKPPSPPRTLSKLKQQNRCDMARRRLCPSFSRRPFA